MAAPAHSATATTNIYTNTFRGPAPFQTETKESIWELVGKFVGDTKQHSIAYVKIGPNGCSTSHKHEHAEETYVILNGVATVTINGISKRFSPGGIVHTPPGNIHQVHNKTENNLTLLCVCSDPWTPDCFAPADMPTSGEWPEEPLERHIVARESVASGQTRGATKVEDEVSYYILKGEGMLRVGEETKTVQPGELAHFRPGQSYSITSVGSEALEFYRFASTKTLNIEDID